MAMRIGLRMAKLLLTASVVMTNPNHTNAAEITPFLSVTWPMPRCPIRPARTQAIATSAKSILDTDKPPAETLAEVVRNHVRQVLANIEIFRIQFTELFKLTSERADPLRRDMWAYVHAIAEVIEAGQKDGTFVDVPAVTQALLILGMCNETTAWYSADRTPLSIDEVADYTARMALAGATGNKRTKR